MTRKILILSRALHSLEIQDEEDDLSYSYLQGITHIEKDKTDEGIETRSVELYNGPISKGFVTNVKEIKERGL
jgi:hypothetical protein